MTLDEILAALVVAGLGAGGAVSVARAVVDAAWPTRTVTLRWVWRPLSVVAGAVLGYLSGQTVEAAAVGAGGGMLTTAIVAWAARGLGGPVEPKP